MAIAAASTVRRLKRQGRVDIIDAHFTYPDGVAATMVARWLSVPVTVTMRGTEVRHSRDPALRHQLEKALGRADRIFSVSSSLKTLAIEMGIDPERVRVVGNGVDSGAFRPGDRQDARRVLELEDDALVLVTVGGLVERKGFHRVIACLPELVSRVPKVHYLVVGGPGPEGDYSPELLKQVGALGLTERVRFLGALPRDGVRQALSASDVFVLSSRNEGWANVLLEAMACGLPVVATDVGGNAEVVCRADLGTIVPFGDSAALASALEGALERSWDRSAIRHYAEQNDWSGRVEILVEEFRRLGGCDPAVAPYLDNAR